LDAPLQLKESDPDITCFATFSCMKHTYTFLWAVLVEILDSYIGGLYVCISGRVALLTVTRRYLSLFGYIRSFCR